MALEPSPRVATGPWNITQVIAEVWATSPSLTQVWATQLAAEQWITTSPQMQMTQVAVEQWAPISSVGVQLVATQMAVEQWATVAVSTGGEQIRVMVMA